MFAERGEFQCDAPKGASLPLQKANCVSYFKNAEGPLVEYRYNECGFRSVKPCGPKPRDTVRVVLIGTSITMGLYVPADETFPARTEKALNQICNRPVEVQNMGALTNLSSVPEIAGKALELSPDVVVLTVVPFDIETLPAPAQHLQPDAQAWVPRIKMLGDQVSRPLRDSKLAFAAAHFMLLDPQILYRTYLMNGGSRDVMSFPPTASAERKYGEFEAVLDHILAKVKGSGVPIIVAAVPNRVAAAMVSNRSQVEGTDAYWFGRHISEIAVQRGALPLDLTPVFANSLHAEQLYYPVDNHPTGQAHAIIARALVDRLTDGSILQLAACRAPQGGR
jgi:hypothetical protein